MKIRKLIIRNIHKIVYDINPFFDSVLDEKNPKNATIIMPTPVNISTCGSNSGSDS
jgi:hypothetical protein